MLICGFKFAKRFSWNSCWVSFFLVSSCCFLLRKRIFPKERLWWKAIMILLKLMIQFPHWFLKKTMENTALSIKKEKSLSPINTAMSAFLQKTATCWILPTKKSENTAPTNTHRCGSTIWISGLIGAESAFTFSKTAIWGNAIYRSFPNFFMLIFSTIPTEL